MSVSPAIARSRADFGPTADEAMEDGGDATADASNGKRVEGDSDEEGDVDDLDFDMEAPGRCRGGSSVLAPGSNRFPQMIPTCLTKN